MKPEDLVISIPHAGTHIPPEIRSRIPHHDHVLLHEPDLYTDRIYNVAGPRIIQAKVNRIISDVNRAPDEIYTEGRMRAQGVIMLSQSHGELVFERDPSLQELQEWIRLYHNPFHLELRKALRDGKFLIDGHSMWSVAPPSRKDAGTPRADVVLGNRLYAACDARTTKFFEQYFQHLGYSVAINDPFTGRFIIGAHCSRYDVPGIQIELKRSLYMDEELLEARDEDIHRLHNEIQGLVLAFCEWTEREQPQGEMTDLSH